VKRFVCCVSIVQISLRILTCFLVVCVLCEPQRAAVYQAGAAKKGAPELVGHGQSQSSRHDSGVIYGWHDSFVVCGMTLVWYMGGMTHSLCVAWLWCGIWVTWLIRCVWHDSGVICGWHDSFVVCGMTLVWCMGDMTHSLCVAWHVGHIGHVGSCCTSICDSWYMRSHVWLVSFLCTPWLMRRCHMPRSLWVAWLMFVGVSPASVAGDIRAHTCDIRAHTCDIRAPTRVRCYRTRWDVLFERAWHPG